MRSSIFAARLHRVRGTRRRTLQVACAAAIAGTAAIVGLTLVPASAGAAGTVVDVQAAQPWTDTGIALSPGQTVIIKASGTIYYGRTVTARPDGFGFNSVCGYDLYIVSIRDFVAPGLRCWSMIAKIGSGGYTFPIYGGFTFVVPGDAPGELYLGVNDSLNGFSDNSGHWTATISTS